MIQYKDRILLLSMVIIVLFLLGSFTSPVSNATTTTTLTNLLEELFLPHIPVTFADHGQEISLKLNSAEFTPLSGNRSANQVRVLVNYTINDQSISNQTINSVMKVYSLNGTLLKTSSPPKEFTINNTGIKRHASSLVNNTIENVTAVVQFTDALKTVPVSNPVQVELDLTQSTPPVSEAAVIRPEIAALS